MKKLHNFLLLFFLVFSAHTYGEDDGFTGPTDSKCEKKLEEQTEQLSAALDTPAHQKEFLESKIAVHRKNAEASPYDTKKTELELVTEAEKLLTKINFEDPEYKSSKIYTELQQIINNLTTIHLLHSKHEEKKQNALALVEELDRYVAYFTNLQKDISKQTASFSELLNPEGPDALNSLIDKCKEILAKIETNRIRVDYSVIGFELHSEFKTLVRETENFHNSILEATKALRELQAQVLIKRASTVSNYQIPDMLSDIEGLPSKLAELFVTYINILKAGPNDALIARFNMIQVSLDKSLTVKYESDPENSAEVLKAIKTLYQDIAENFYRYAEELLETLDSSAANVSSPFFLGLNHQAMFSVRAYIRNFAADLISLPIPEDRASDSSGYAFDFFDFANARIARAEGSSAIKAIYQQAKAQSLAWSSTSQESLLSDYNPSDQNKIKSLLALTGISGLPSQIAGTLSSVDKDLEMSDEEVHPVSYSLKFANLATRKVVEQIRGAINAFQPLSISRTELASLYDVEENQIDEATLNHFNESIASLDFMTLMKSYAEDGNLEILYQLVAHVHNLNSEKEVTAYLNESNCLSCLFEKDERSLLEILGINPAPKEETSDAAPGAGAEGFDPAQMEQMMKMFGGAQ